MISLPHSTYRAVSDVHRVASALVEWIPRLMDGHDTTRMGIDDTVLGDWTTRHVNTTDQGQLGETGTIMERKQTESTTRNEQEGGSRGF